VTEHGNFGRDGEGKRTRTSTCDLCSARSGPWDSISRSEVLTKSGVNPKPRKSRILAWVGFVLSSPLMAGTRLTWIKAKLSCPTLNWNCRIASTKGADSISPTVPPS
jgi:hypothetical protein